VAAADERAERTYGNWRKPSSPGIGSLGLAGTMLLLGGLVLAVLATLFAPLAGLAVLLLVGVLLLPLFLRDRFGRTALQRITARLAWQRGRARGQHLYRSGPLSVQPGGAFRLPGLAASSQMLEAQDSYGRPFGLIEIPSLGHYTAVFNCSADGASLVDPGQVDTWVAHWGGWLASLAHEPGLLAAQVVIEAAPDPGTRLAHEVSRRLDPASPELARQVVGEIVQRYPAGSAQISTRIAVTYAASARPGAPRRSRQEMAREIGTRLPGLGAGLAMTGAGEARPMTARALAEAVRIAYDPSVQAAVEQAQAAGGSGLTWEQAGPAASQEYWDHYLHDSAASMSWTMAEAPRGEVMSGVLAGLLAPHPAIARKRVTLVYRPHDPATAARIVERDRRDAQFRLGGSRLAARDAVQIAAAEQSAREEARGAGVVRFAMIVTTTVGGPDQLPAAAAAIDTLAPPARVQLRVAYGSQAAAFSAGLPIGIVLPYHVRLPQSVRDAI
jgi:hypothetical protein